MDPIAEQLIARLQHDPNDLSGYHQLKSHYEQLGDFASLANLLEGWAGAHAQDWANAAQAYFEAAEAVLRMGSASGRAKQLYHLALGLNVLHPDAGTRLIALLDHEAQYPELAEFLDSYANALESAGATIEFRGEILQQLGHVWQHRLGRPDAAEAYFERAAQLVPAAAASDSGAQAALPADEARALADGYEQQALASSDPGQRAALLSQLAEVRARSLDDLEGAIVALRQALAAMPGDVAVMHQLATCLIARAEGAEPEAARTDYRRAAELLYQIAQGIDEAEAMPYLESALAAMPDHDGALALLERLAPAQGREDVLPGYWVSYVAAAGEGPEADQRRLLLAQAYLAADQIDDAIFCLQAAAEHGNGRAHELLQEVYAHQAQAGTSSREATDSSSSNRLPAQRHELPKEDQEQARLLAEIVEHRKQVHDALAARRHDDAADHARALLALDPIDAEAFNVLESHYRKRRDYTSLRDLLLSSTRMPGLAVDARKMRLREVATLSEAKLRDADGATSAWRGVVTLDPADREALGSLKRLLKKAQQWDELASVLEREALATTGLEEKSALIREIALLHRDKRKDPIETAEALRQLYALKPDDGTVRDELCALLIEIEQYQDAVPLLRERIAASSEDSEKQKLSASLAAILHEKLRDLEGAYELCRQMLKRKPNDKSAFERMERIDQESGNFERLLGLLEKRVEVATKADRPALYTRMGVIAEEQLHDIDKAADCFGDALDLAPDREDALSRLVELFERAGRYDQLVELLRERALLEKEPKNRAPFFRRIAHTLATQLDDTVGAADAYRKLLELEEHEEGLRYLRQTAIRNDDPEELADVLRRLAACVSDERERRDFSFDLAVLLHERLARTPEAAATLKRLVEQIDPRFEPAIELLGEISEASGDRKGLALALERRLALARDAASRLPLAKRLADLYEGELADETKAIAALESWARDEAQNPAPRRRLRKRLERAAAWPALLVALDALAEWEDSFEARDEATIAAAKLAFEHLNDAEGAWRRLLALVEERNETADAALREIAARAGLLRQLCALYVRLAQETDDPSVQSLHWGSAAELFENALDDAPQALEASLRRLAAELSNREILAHVERLARKTKAWKRLAQVYDRLLKQAEDDSEKVELLRRHAELLVDEQPDEALDRVVRACALAPDDEQLLARAEELAERTRRSEELLVVYDRRRARSDDEPDKLRLSLRAARLCDGALRDRERAIQYLKTALSITALSPELAPELEAAARALDAARPDLGVDNARRALVRAHREVAERIDPTLAVRLLLRGAELLAVELDDERAAFDMLRQALALLPNSDELYNALFALAEKQSRLDSLDAHLSRLVEDAIDSQTAVALLRRRGALLEGRLNRFQDAAAVYTKLLQLRPDDAHAGKQLRKNLRQSGRHQDLLLALNKQLQRTRDPEQRIAMLREIAQTWEHDLKNRWEALDAWKAVLRENFEDAAASAAIKRLERSRVPGSDAPPDEQAPPDEVTEERSIAPEVSRDRPDADTRVTPVPGTMSEVEPPASISTPMPTPAALAFAEAEEPEAISAAARPASEPPHAPAPQEAPLARPFEPESETDLDALDAAMSARPAKVEELDLLLGSSLPKSPSEPPPERARRSTPPPPPPRNSAVPAQPRAAAMPPRPTQAPARSAAAPPPPPPSLQTPRRSAPPPLPGRAEAPVQSARPAPPAPSVRSGGPPPLPAARTASQPPPLPRKRD